MIANASVLLPAPFVPTSAWISRSATVRSRPSRIRRWFARTVSPRTSSSATPPSDLVELVLGAPALVALGGEQHVAVRVLTTFRGGVHQPAARARLGILLPALGALRIADAVARLLAHGEQRHRSPPSATTFPRDLSRGWGGAGCGEHTPVRRPLLTPP